MLAEQRFVLSEADRAQPLADVHVGAAYAETGTLSPRWGMESRTCTRNKVPDRLEGAPKQLRTEKATIPCQTAELVVFC